MPEPFEIDQYEKMNIGGIAIYVHTGIKITASTRIDGVTGRAGTKLFLLGFAGSK